MIPRVIPTLLLDRGRLVKTVRFRDSTYIGDPINAVRIFNEKEVDEMVFLDISATRDGREPNFELIGRIASEAFMPFTYGGGVRSVSHAQRLFALGVEKVVLNTAALRTPELISDLAALAGRSSVVVSIDVKRPLLGRARVFTSDGYPPPKANPVDFARHVVELGAGELVLTAVDREGTMTGYDLELVQQVASAVDVPLIALGGAGTTGHLRDAIGAGASAVAAGSLFVYHGPRRAVLITYPAMTTLEELFGEDS